MARSLRPFFAAKLAVKDRRLFCTFAPRVVLRGIVENPGCRGRRRIFPVSPQHFCRTERFYAEDVVFFYIKPPTPPRGPSQPQHPPANPSSLSHRSPLTTKKGSSCRKPESFCLSVNAAFLYSRSPMFCFSIREVKVEDKHTSSSSVTGNKGKLAARTCR